MEQQPEQKPLKLLDGTLLSSIVEFEPRWRDRIDGLDAARRRVEESPKDSDVTERYERMDATVRQELLDAGYEEQFVNEYPEPPEEP